MGNEIYPFYSGVLSNWHKCNFVVEGVRFNCAEQYMMYSKAILFGDFDAAKLILNSQTPREQKAAGRMVRGFDEGRWKMFRSGIVFTGNLHKFSQNKKLLEFLLSTGSAQIVEASPKDRIWGVGLAADDERIMDPSQWKGLNLLGIALVQVREVLRWESQGL